MAQSRYAKALKVLKEYMYNSKRNYIYTQDLRNLIIRKIAGTENIITATLKLLRETGVIKEIKLHKWKIKI